MAAVSLLLAALLFRSCLGAEDQKVPPPTFDPDSIVNSANGSSASLTPNGLASVRGSNLADVTQAAVGDGRAELPTYLGGVRMRVGGIDASLLSVSPTKVNFLIPSGLKPGNTEVSLTKINLVVRTPIKLIEAAPALFSDDGRVAAEHADGSLISPDSPAKPGEIVVIYGAGLGRTDPSQIDGLIPRFAARILLFDQLRVFLEGELLPADSILYAGITPGSAGLYQINLRLPDTIGKEDPELRVALGDQISQSSLVLRVAPVEP